MSKKNFKRLHESLSLAEQKLVIMTYRDYKISVQGIPEVFFGSDFEKKLSDAVTNADYRGIATLRVTLREVFNIVITIQKHKDAYPDIFNTFFKENLSQNVFEKLYGEAGIEV